MGKVVSQEHFGLAKQDKPTRKATATPHAVKQVRSLGRKYLLLVQGIRTEHTLEIK